MNHLCIKYKSGFTSHITRTSLGLYYIFYISKVIVYVHVLHRLLYAKIIQSLIIMQLVLTRLFLLLFNRNTMAIVIGPVD